MASDVNDFDDNLHRLAHAMTHTMRAHGGVGLAAPQVGVLRRLFTFADPGDEHHAPHAGTVINPVLLDASVDLATDDEGCLSFPGLFRPVARPLEVVMHHQGLAGDEHETTLRGFGARIWLHELDHLNGILLIDHLARHDRREALRLLRERDLDAAAPRTPS